MPGVVQPDGTKEFLLVVRRLRLYPRTLKKGAFLRE
jgi:hypothetical protein